MLSFCQFSNVSVGFMTSYYSNIDGITGFSDDDTQSVIRHMKYVIELAKSRDDLVIYP